MNPSTDNPFSTRHTRPGAIPYRFACGESVEELVRRLRENRWLGQIVGPHGSGKSTLLAALIPAIKAAGKSVLLVELHDGQRRLPVRLSTPLVPPLQSEIFNAFDDPEAGRENSLSLREREGVREAAERIASVPPHPNPLPKEEGTPNRCFRNCLIETGSRDSTSRNWKDLLIIDGYEQLSHWNRFRLRRFCRRHDLGLLVTAHASVGLPDLLTMKVECGLVWEIVERLMGDRPPLIAREELLARLERHRGNFREVLFDLYDLYEQETGKSESISLSQE